MPSSNEQLKSSETPRGAVEEVIAAVNARDFARLSSRLDLKSFIDFGYDDAIDQLALNCARFHERYPDDLLFKFGSKALRAYNALFRSVHIGLIMGIVQAYFNREFKSLPSFSSDPIGFCAFHFARLIEALHSEIVDEDQETVTVKVTADGAFKNLIGTLTFELETALSNGRFKVLKIANAEELVEPIVDIAEKVWPREWDRGIRL